MDAASNREILALALPALGALAADPLLSMVDTALVGHLGAPPLAALAVSVVAFNLLFMVFNFLAYGTTGPVARLMATDRPHEALRYTAQAVWVALALGVTGTLVGLVAARPLGMALGARGQVLDLFLQYFRIRIFALTPMLLMLVGNGLFRGLQDTRTPLVIVVVANLVNAVLAVVLIYPVGLGVRGAAIATVTAQTGAAALFAWQAGRRLAPYRQPGLLRPQRDAMRELLGVSRDLLVRTLSLYSVFVAATAVAARMGTTTVAGHQVAVELWMFLAMILDSLAIAAQALIGRYLGVQAQGAARLTGDRLIRWGVVFGAVLGLGYWLARDLLPRIFTSDPEVLATVALVMPFVAGFQPLNGFVFVLDGIIIGAVDTRFLAPAMLISALAGLPLVLLSLPLGWGIQGVWLGLSVFMVARAITMGLRYRSGKWLVTGSLRLRRAGLTDQV